MFRARGYRFITLDAALEDPAYTLPEAPAARGLSWLYRWMLAKGLPMQAERLEPSFITGVVQAAAAVARNVGSPS